MHRGHSLLLLADNIHGEDYASLDYTNLLEDTSGSSSAVVSVEAITSIYCKLLPVQIPRSEKQPSVPLDTSTPPSGTVKCVPPKHAPTNVLEDTRARSERGMFCLSCDGTIIGVE